MNQKEQKWLVLLYTLFEMAGGGPRSAVLQHINDCGYWDKNDENDVLRDTRNEKAWRNDFSFERHHLVEHGYMKSGGNGLWEITEEGRKHLSDLKERAKHLKFDTNDVTFRYTSIFLEKLFLSEV